MLRYPIGAQIRDDINNTLIFQLRYSCDSLRRDSQIDTPSLDSCKGIDKETHIIQIEYILYLPSTPLTPTMHQIHFGH